MAKRKGSSPPPGDESASQAPPASTVAPPTPDPVGELFALLGEGPHAGNVSEARAQAASRSLQKIVADHEVVSEYNVLILHDEGSLVRSDADRIYRAIRDFKDKRDILLVLYSPGGEVEPAYLISQLCREWAKDRFIVAVPRRAKSAATLICCGADEIHMGPMSELGPIDPQIGDHPALGLGNALRHIAAIVSDHPGAATMFAEYMAKSVRAIDLGYYERVVESAAQYAERLLESRQTTLPRSAGDVAKTLVYEYKDHGFVIDRREARRILGEDAIVSETKEYQLANAIYEHLDFIRFLAGIKKQRMYWVGSLSQGCTFYDM